jgi:hypothetical protein
MPIELDDLLENYSSAVQEGKGALFIGAGMSRSRGFVDWKGLIRPYARQVGLDVEKETDLVAIAQYYLNSKNRERSFLNQALIEEFDRPCRGRNHQRIARLPISTIWTTNYDQLIEEGFRKTGKRLDVKLRDKDIGFSRWRCDAVLYKMHGDISQPDKVIISKEDYEIYARTHPVFQSKLTTDLLEKSFLFLGLSFDDPNLNYTLGHLCSLVENNKRPHYAVIRKVRRKVKYKWNQEREKYDCEPDELFRYRERKQELRVDDLQRYGIDTFLFDNEKEVPWILGLLRRRIRIRTSIRKLIQELHKKYPALSEPEVKDIAYKAFGFDIFNKPSSSK